jgi:hypothetical protein
MGGRRLRQRRRGRPHGGVRGPGQVERPPDAAEVHEPHGRVEIGQVLMERLEDEAVSQERIDERLELVRL